MKTQTVERWGWYSKRPDLPFGIPGGFEIETHCQHGPRTVSWYETEAEMLHAVRLLEVEGYEMKGAQ